MIIAAGWCFILMTDVVITILGFRVDRRMISVLTQEGFYHYDLISHHNSGMIGNVDLISYYIGISSPLW